MNTKNKTTKVEDMKVKLSTLWVFATLNYLCCQRGKSVPESPE